MRGFGIGLLSLLVLAGCSKPLPTDKSAYAGDWRSPTMGVLISQDGRAAYKRQMGTNGSKLVSGPIQSFEGDNFVVGVGPIHTTFVVSAPPHQDHVVGK